MAFTRDVEKKLKDFDYNCWSLAEALLDCEEELNKKIEGLEKEIQDHNCNS